jgi:hypothetical protein
LGGDSCFIDHFFIVAIIKSAFLYIFILVLGGQMSSDTIVSDIISKDIIDLLDLGNLPQEKQEEYRKLATQTVCNRAFSRLTDLLEEKGLLDEYQKVPEDDRSVREFLTKNEIDLDNLVAEEAVTYKAQMKTLNDVLNVGITLKSED